MQITITNMNDLLFEYKMTYYSNYLWNYILSISCNQRSSVYDTLVHRSTK